MSTYTYSSYMLGGEDSAIVFTREFGAKAISEKDTPELWSEFLKLKHTLSLIEAPVEPNIHKRRALYAGLDGEGIKAMRLQLKALCAGIEVQEFSDYLKKIELVLQTFPRES